MIIVDTALAKRLQAGNPVRVAMVGAGYMARGIALQILTAMPGIRLVAISQPRRVARRSAPTEQAGVDDVARVAFTPRAGASHRERPLRGH